ncbi:hypothetical protein [Lutispora sp.]|uniref:hypothetical protein n=1 Tax=Lutispora sp. TaxID=2828727 RepID=UPI00356AB198
MIDFWFAAIMTFIITLITITFDSITGKLICYAKYRKTISDILSKGLSREDAAKLIERSHYQLKSNENVFKIWGSDIALVSISVDLTALGLYISSPYYFPFFQRFNSTNSNREILVWILVIMLHMLLIMITMIMKHNHISNIDFIDNEGNEIIINSSWLSKQKYVLVGNSCGFISLMSSIVFITNAI